MAKKAAEKKPAAKKARPAKAASKKKAVAASARISSKADDFRAATDELGDRVAKLKKEQFNLRFQRANGQLEKTSRIRVVRKDIARIQTIMTEQRRKAG